MGRINLPSYRVIVTEHTASPKAGKYVDKVGTYNPRTKERVLNEERIKYWLSVGAKPSDTVHNMLVSLGIIKGKKINVLKKFVEPVKEEVAEAPAAAPAAPAAEEAPAEEAAPVEEAPADAPSETPAEEEKPAA